jgi:DNA-binding response OmpR family regulator
LFDSPPEPHSAGRDGMKRRMVVLVVDDEPVIRDILRLVLEYSQIEVFEAESCAQALSILENNRLDAVILDNSLPDGEGVRLLPQITKHCSRVIMATADEYRIRDQALASGAEAIFAKPFDAFELLKRLADIPL